MTRSIGWRASRWVLLLLLIGVGIAAAGIAISPHQPGSPARRHLLRAADHDAALRSHGDEIISRPDNRGWRSGRSRRYGRARRKRPRH